MRVLIYGAGSTGCYIGAQLALAGIPVELLGRERICTQIENNHGISISNFHGEQAKTDNIPFVTQLTRYDYTLCLVTLKCHQLPSAEQDLKHLQDAGCELHFLQNGLNAKGRLHSIKDKQAYSGIIPFNVLSQGEGHFHQGTEGALQLQGTPLTHTLHTALQRAHIQCELYDDIAPIVNGKLLLNLNNALNAISDLPLKTELEDRRFRLVLAKAMDEYLALCKAEAWPLKISAPLPAQCLPSVLRLPNFLFTRIAKKLLAIDPLARSSMWEDIQANRKTEIEFLNGHIAHQCKAKGLPSRTNETITRMIATLEKGERVELTELFKNS